MSRRRGSKQSQPLELHRNRLNVTVKNADLGKMMADATSSLVEEAANEAVQEQKSALRQEAKSKLKGLFKKPRFP